MKYAAIFFLLSIAQLCVGSDSFKEKDCEKILSFSKRISFPEVILELGGISLNNSGFGKSAKISNYEMLKYPKREDIYARITFAKTKSDSENKSIMGLAKYWGADPALVPSSYWESIEYLIKGTRYPLVVVQYRSRGFLRGGVGDEHPIHVLAASGFAVLSFDSPRGKYEQLVGDALDRQALYLKHAIIDKGPATAIENMIRELDRRGIIDPNRVGLTGVSHGATTVDTALLRKDYAAAATAYSWTSPPNFDVSASSFWGKAMNAAFGGTPYSDKGFEKRAENSIGVNADSIDTPYLIQVADREYHLTKQNFHALKDAGKPVELWIYPNEYHVKWQPAHRYNVYRRNLQWFMFWLQNKEHGRPVDPDQYGRWKKMRDDHCANMDTDKKDATPYCH